MKHVLVATLIFGLFCGRALAQEQTTPPPKTPRITKRQVNQQARTKQGVKTGALTKGETLRLEKEQAKIQKDKGKAKSDGKVTPKERLMIRREQNKANRDIYRLKHNNSTQQ